MNADSGTVAPGVSDASSSSVAARRKPRLALFIATACGLGYIPVAPGTFGSLAGLALALLPFWTFVLIIGAFYGGGVDIGIGGKQLDPFLLSQILLTFLTAALGVWGANRAAEFWQQKDPKRVVIYEG